MEKVSRVLHTEEARKDRVEKLRESTGKKLATFDVSGLSACSVRGNIENFLGTISIPVGLAGPLLFNFENGSEKLTAPIATSEGALVSSITRGAFAISLSEGVTARVLSNKMIRAPQFEFNSIVQAIQFREWLAVNTDKLKQKVRNYSGFAELLEVDPKIMGKTAHVRFVYSTGDAAGQNMTTFVTHSLCQWILRELEFETDIEVTYFGIEGNLSSDKKASVITAIEGRGRTVVAETTVKRSVVKRILKCTPEDLVVNFVRCKSARMFSGMIGFNINVANLVAGMFIATGQDAACIHECSVAELHLEVRGEDLYASLYMPSLIVGTVGGGVSLPGARDGLEVLGCYGHGKADRLAQIICGYALALELSTVSAIAGGQFVEAHHRLGRQALGPSFTKKDLTVEFFQENVEAFVGAEIAKVKEDTSFIVEDSLMMDLALQVSKRYCGILAYNVQSTNGHNEKVLVKIKPHDSELIHATSIMAQAIDTDLSRLIINAENEHPFLNTHIREIEVHKLGLPSLAAIAPKNLGAYVDPDSGAYVLFQEFLLDVHMLNSLNRRMVWGETHIREAIRAVSQFHKEAKKYVQDIQYVSWIPPVFKLDMLVKNKALWVRINELSRSQFGYDVGNEIFEVIEDKIENLSTWWDEYLSDNTTLIHNDFNPRNLAFRGTPDAPELVAFDWKLVTIGTPQRDVMELLSFVATEDTPPEKLREWILYHHKQTQSGLSEKEWLRRAELALFDFAVHRLSMYSIPAYFGRANYLRKVYGNISRFHANREVIFR